MSTTRAAPVRAWFTVNSGGSLGGSIDPYGAATAVPNVIGTHHTIGDPHCWVFDSQNPYCAALGQGLTDAFQWQAPGQFGNAGRKCLARPHLRVFDFGLFKDFPVGERVNAQFCREVLNLTNTPIFGAA